MYTCPTSECQNQNGAQGIYLDPLNKTENIAFSELLITAHIGTKCTNQARYQKYFDARHQSLLAGPLQAPVM
jgi:hypothetical protein